MNNELGIINNELFARSSLIIHYPLSIINYSYG